MKWQNWEITWSSINHKTILFVLYSVGLGSLATLSQWMAFGARRDWPMVRIVTLGLFKVAVHWVIWEDGNEKYFRRLDLEESILLYLIFSPSFLITQDLLHRRFSSASRECSPTRLLVTNTKSCGTHEDYTYLEWLVGDSIQFCLSLLII